MQNKIEVPEEWKYGDENGNTNAMKLAMKGIIPGKEY